MCVGPGIAQDEMKGRGYRVDVTQTYIVNTDFLAQAKKVEQSGHKMLVQRPTGHDSARQRLRRLHHSTAHEMSVASHSGMTSRVCIDSAC
jgi:hypothetical protein